MIPGLTTRTVRKVAAGKVRIKFLMDIIKSIKCFERL